MDTKVNQLKLFVGEEQDIVSDTYVNVKDGQFLIANDTGDIFKDINGNRIRIAFHGDWNENDSASSTYINNRTHYRYQDENGDIQVKKLDVDFLPDGADAVVLTYEDARNAAANATPYGNSESQYHIGQMILVVDKTPIQWYYITETNQLGKIAGAVEDLDLSSLIKKTEVIQDWGNSLNLNETLPISYGAVHEIVGDIYTELSSL